MSAFDALEDAIECLQKSVTAFPIGAVCLDDLEPSENRIQTLKERLKYENAKILKLKARKAAGTTTDSPTCNTEETVKILQQTTANFLINNNAIKLCLHSYTLPNILSKRQGTPEIQKKISAYATKLCKFNDYILSLHLSIEKALQKRLSLKCECRKSIVEYKNFLKKQEEMRNKKLQQTNPEIAKNKERMERTIRKINVMKQLIRNLMPLSNSMLKEEPLLLEMTEKHRELITVEQIVAETG